MIEYDSVLVKYNEIWNKTKEILNIKFNSMPFFDKKYIKNEVKELNGVINTNFWGDKVQKKVSITLLQPLQVLIVIKMEKILSASLFGSMEV